MQQGLTLLIQLIVELAPVIVSLVQKKKEANITKFQPFKEIPELLSSVYQLSNTEDEGNDFQQQKLLQQQLVVYDRQTQLQIATHERETALKLPEIDKILENWPLRLYPSQILESSTSNSRTPLKIFLAPPKIQFDEFDHGGDESSDIEITLAEGLRDFLNKHYSLHSQTRPTEFLAGAWNSKRFHSESSIKTLFGMLKSEPVLILESEVDGDYLNFRIGYWGLGQNNYFYKTISRIPYQEILQQSAKTRAWEWRQIRDEFSLIGEDLGEIDQFGGDNLINLTILEKIEKWESKGIDLSKISLKYKVNRQDFTKLCDILITCHCLVTAWVADAFHLINYDVSPLLPQLLPNLLKGVSDLQAIEAIVSSYAQLYQALEQNRRYWIPELALQLAHSLASLPDKSWASEQIDYSLTTWLQLRQVPLKEVKNFLQAMQSVVSIEDIEYLENLKQYFTKIGNTDSVEKLDEIISRITILKQQNENKHSLLYNTLIGHTGKVSTIAISQDRQTLVSGCADKSIKVWNLKTGNLIRTITELGEISSIAVSPDGNLLAAGIEEAPKSNVRVWNLKTGQLVHTLLGHHKPVNVVTISPDGQILASGSNKIKIWDLHKGERICTLWHSSSVNATAITPNCATLVSGTSDNKIRVWNPHNGEPLRTFIGHFAAVKSLVISPDGKIVFSGSTDKTIKIWDLQTGKILHTLTGHSDEVKSLAISPDGLILISGSADQTIKIWHWQRGEVLQTINEHSGSVNSLAISTDGKFFASGSNDKTIKIWQIST